MLALVGLLTSSTIAQGPVFPFGIPGEFDTLVLARFWQPQSALCGTFGAQNLTLHGLWPQYDESRSNAKHTNQSWPQYCGKDDAAHWDVVDPVQASVAADFDSAWRERAPLYPSGLAQHEWEKHGTCALASVANASNATEVAALQRAYFTSQLALMRAEPTPAIIHAALSSGNPIALKALQDAFGGPTMVGLSCDVDAATKHARLIMVSQCWAHSAEGAPTQRVPCPTATMLTSTYDNGCALDGHELIYVHDLPCGSAEPSNSPSAQASALVGALYLIYGASALAALVLEIGGCARRCVRIARADDRAAALSAAGGALATHVALCVLAAGLVLDNGRLAFGALLPSAALDSDFIRAVTYVSFALHDLLLPTIVILPVCEAALAAPLTLRAAADASSALEGSLDEKKGGGCAKRWLAACLCGGAPLFPALDRALPCAAALRRDGDRLQAGGGGVLRSACCVKTIVRVSYAVIVVALTVIGIVDFTRSVSLPFVSHVVADGSIADGCAEFGPDAAVASSSGAAAVALATAGVVGVSLVSIVAGVWLTIVVRWPVLLVLAAVSTVGQGANMPFVGVVSNFWEQVLVWALVATQLLAFTERPATGGAGGGGGSRCCASSVDGSRESLLASPSSQEA